MNFNKLFNTLATGSLVLSFLCMFVATLMGSINHVRSVVYFLALAEILKWYIVWMLFNKKYKTTPPPTPPTNIHRKSVAVIVDSLLCLFLFNNPGKTDFPAINDALDYLDKTPDFLPALGIQNLIAKKKNKK